MEERMEEARIGLIDEVDEVDESEVVTTALTDAQIEVLKRKANDAIRISATERKNSKSFKGEAIDHSIAELQLSGLEDTEEYFALILERLMCECKVVYDKPNEHKAYIYDYAFEDLEAFKSSKSYQLLCEMGGKHRRLFDVAEESIFSQISRYYSVLAEYGDVDVVIIYDAERKDIYEKLCDELNANDTYLNIKSFSIESDERYSEPEVLSALYKAPLMICLSSTLEVGEGRFHTEQFKDIKSVGYKTVLHVTEEKTDSEDGTVVSYSDEDFAARIKKKALLFVDGAAPKEKYIIRLEKREEDIQHCLLALGSNKTDAEAKKKLLDLIESQIADLEDFSVLYSGLLPCDYSVSELEEIEKEIEEQSRYNEKAAERTIKNILQANERINAIIANKDPIKIYERYVKLCRLVEAQKENVRKLSEYLSAEEIKERLAGVMIDDTRLNKEKNTYRRVFKEAYLETFMRPFDKSFTECVALDCLSPLKIEKHKQNFDKFEECGIYAGESDGLTYWSKDAFMCALQKKRDKQNYIDETIRRLNDFAAKIERFVHNSHDPNFKEENLKGLASGFTDEVARFANKTGLTFSYKKPIYEGYRGKICFIKYANEELLNKDVERAIRNHKKLMDEAKRQRDLDNEALREKKHKAQLHYATAEAYAKERRGFPGGHTAWHDYLKLEVREYQRAAELGHPDALCVMASYHEVGFGVMKSIDLALINYERAAYKHNCKAQLWLADHYRKKNDPEREKEWLERAVKDKSSFACIRLGNIYNEEGQLDKAVEHYMLANEISPGYVSVAQREIIASYHIEKGDHEEALKWLVRCVDSDKVLKLKGDCYFKAGDKHAAAEAYSKVENGLSEELYRFTADTLFEDGRYEAALKAYLALSDRTELAVKKNVAACYMELDKKAEAIAVYEEILTVEASGEILKAVADHYYDEGRIDAAIPYYEKYAEDNSDDLACLRLGSYYENMRQNDVACSYFSRCLDYALQRKDALSLANLMYAEDRLEEAVVCFGKVLEINNAFKLTVLQERKLVNQITIEKFADWYRNYGYILHEKDNVKRLADHLCKTGDKENAVKLYEYCCKKFFDFSEENVMYIADYYEEKGDIYLARRWATEAAALCFRYRNEDGAIKYYEKSDLTRVTPEALMFVANAYFDRGAIEKSFEWYDRYYKKSCDHRVARELADKLWKLERIADAIAWYERYTDLIRSADVAGLVGGYYLENGMNDKAVSFFEKFARNAAMLDNSFVDFMVEYYTKADDKSGKDRWLAILGDRYSRENDEKKALELYEKCDVESLSAENLLFVANYRYAGGMIEESLKWYEYVYNRKKDATMARELADKLWKLERRADAIVWYERYISERRSPNTVKKVVDYYIDNGMKKEAARLFERYVDSKGIIDVKAMTFMVEYYTETNDKSRLAVWAASLGNEYYASGECSKAMECYEKCSPDLLSAPALTLVADRYFEDGRVEDSLKWYEYVYNREKNVIMARELADKLWKLERRADAIVWYERYISERRSPNTVKRVVDYYIDNGMKKEAARLFERYVDFKGIIDVKAMTFMVEYYTETNDKSRLEVWAASLGNEYYASGECSKAMECYEKCSPDLLSAPALTLVADRYFEDGRVEDSLKLYERAYDLCKDADLAKKVYEKMAESGKKLTVAEWYERFALSHPAPDHYRYLADLYFAANALTEAATYYEKLLKYRVAVDEAFARRMLECYKAQATDNDAIRAGYWAEELVTFLIAKNDLAEAKEVILEWNRNLSRDHKASIAKQSPGLARSVGDAFFGEADKYSKLNRNLSRDHKESIAKQSPGLARSVGDAFFGRADKYAAKDVISAIEWYKVCPYVEIDEDLMSRMVDCYELVGNKGNASYWVSILGSKVLSDTGRERQSNDQILVVDEKYLFCKSNNDWVMIRPNQVQAYEFCPAGLFKKGSSVICLKDSRPDGVLLKYEVSSDLKKDNALDSTLRSFLAANGCEIKKTSGKR